MHCLLAFSCAYFFAYSCQFCVCLNLQKMPPIVSLHLNSVYSYEQHPVIIYDRLWVHQLKIVNAFLSNNRNQYLLTICQTHWLFPHLCFSHKLADLESPMFSRIFVFFRHLLKTFWLFFTGALAQWTLDKWSDTVDYQNINMHTRGIIDTMSVNLRSGFRSEFIQSCLFP